MGCNRLGSIASQEDVITQLSHENVPVKNRNLIFLHLQDLFYCIVHRDITFAGSGLWSCLLDSSTLLPGNCLGDMDHVVYVIYISPLQSINLINSHTGTKGKAKELIQPFIPCTLQKCLLFLPGQRPVNGLTCIWSVVCSQWLYTGSRILDNDLISDSFIKHGFQHNQNPVYS